VTPASSAVVVSLARVEGRRLLLHPIFLAGVALALIGIASFVKATYTRSGIVWDDDAWTVAAGSLILAILTMVAANHAALRDRRDHTEEQHSTLPVSAATKTGGRLVSMLWPAVVAIALLAVAAGFAVARGVALDGVDIVHLAELGVLVVMLGALGIAIAAWFPNPFVAPLAAWALLLITPDETAQSWHSLTPLAGLRTIGLAAWHLSYLAGLAAIFCLVALARSSRSRSLLGFAILAVGIVGISATVLLARVCPVDGVCHL
jgi:hypothetical protein